MLKSVFLSLLQKLLFVFEDFSPVLLMLALKGAATFSVLGSWQQGDSGSENIQPLCIFLLSPSLEVVFFFF